MLSERAEIDRIVSGAAWLRFPTLLAGVEKWADLAGRSAGDLVISAFPISLEWLSVRVSRADVDGALADWLEWLVPIAFEKASPLAVHHFAARELHGAMCKLRGREFAKNRPKELPLPESLDPSRGEPMAKKAETTPPAPPPKSSTRSKPGKAPAPAATATRSKPEAKPRATTRAAETPPPAPAKMSKPKPGAKPKATTRAETPAPAPKAKPKPKATTRAAETPPPPPAKASKAKPGPKPKPAAKAR